MYENICVFTVQIYTNKYKHTHIFILLCKRFELLVWNTFFSLSHWLFFICMYFNYVLIPNETISLDASPLYFQYSLSSASTFSMYTSDQIQRYMAPNLEPGMCYLDCYWTFTTDYERDQRKCIDAALEVSTPN